MEGGDFVDFETLAVDFVNWKLKAYKNKNISVDKFLGHINNYLLQERNKRFLPTEVSISITEECNLNCIHCYQIKRKRRMDLNNIKKILYELKRNQVLQLTITGGEPFLHPQWSEILQLAKKLGFVIKIQSNDLLLNKEYVTVLRNILNIKTDSIQISLDGSTSEIYNLQRGNANFNKVISNIKYMVEVGLKVILNITPTKKNENDIYEVFKLATKLEVFGFGATPLAYLGKGNNELAPSEDIVIIQENLIISDSKSKVKYFGGVSGEILNLSCIPAFSKSVEKLLNKVDRHEFSCAGGRTKAHIDVNYTVFPCVFAQNIKLAMGNFLKDEFYDIWFNKYCTSDFFRVVRNLNKSKCMKCNLLAGCAGGCAGMAYEKYNSINYPDPRCCK